MVSRFAWNVWKKLPPHTRGWVSVDDLIQDGMIWVLMVGIPRYRKEKAALSTFLYIGLSNYFQTNYLSRSYQVSRCESTTVSLDCLDLVGMDDRKHALEMRVRALRDDRTPEKILRHCWVVPMLVKVFRQASALLRRELRRWFIRTDVERTHLKQRFGRLTDCQLEFSLARHEFLGLARKEGLEYDDCRHILTSPSCQGNLRFALAGL